MSSAIAFVLGLSVVFVTMGATASVIGRFLTHHRSLLTPIGGAIVILFGLQLIGVLHKLNWKVGLGLAAVLIALGVTAQMRPGMLGDWLKPIQFYSLASDSTVRSWPRTVDVSRRPFSESWRK